MLRKRNRKLKRVTSTKDTVQIPKNQISLPESLNQHFMKYADRKASQSIISLTFVVAH